MECKCFQNVLKPILEEMGRILNFKNVYLIYSFLDYYAVVLLVKSVDEALWSPWIKFDTTELDK